MHKRFCWPTVLARLWTRVGCSAFVPVSMDGAHTRCTTTATTAVITYVQEAFVSSGGSSSTCCFPTTGPTLSIYKAGTRVWGGFHDQAWKSRGNYIQSTSAFLYRYEYSTNNYRLTAVIQSCHRYFGLISSDSTQQLAPMSVFPLARLA
jgi:hypothetical protein